MSAVRCESSVLLCLALRNLNSDSLLTANLQVFASFLNTFGINLQKYSHVQNDKRPELNKKAYYNDFLWAAGVILVPPNRRRLLIFGFLCCALAVLLNADGILFPMISQGFL